MQIVSFRIRKYRNIQDSGVVELSEKLTCIVGKNQSGKTALLRALHKFNPHEPQAYNIQREWPRGERRKRDESQIVCEVVFELEPAEVKELAEKTDQEMKAETVIVTKDYSGNFEVKFPDSPDLFSDSLHPNTVDEICSDLPLPEEPVKEEFKQEVSKCHKELMTFAKEGRYSEFSTIHSEHEERLKEVFSPANHNPQHQNETNYIKIYGQRLDEIQKELERAPTMQRDAHDYIISQLPTFIYMDEYREFRGTALLDQI